jgi:hypothetical protein
MRHDRKNEAAEMNAVMLKGVDVWLLGLKFLWVICRNELSQVAKDDDGDAGIWMP